jgi:perosamine synthetase
MIKNSNKINKEIPSAGPWITELEINYVKDAVENGWYNNWSNYIEKFENEFCKYTHNNFTLTTSSCTGALHIALLALGVGPGDEVIVPDISWIATVSCIKYVGATPVFVDIERDTWCIDPFAIKNSITKKTKAIIPVHLFGHPADMDQINKISNEYGLFILEDAAPGIGSKYKGKPVGSLGNAAAFSFQGAKPLVMGEGGALVTNDQNFYDKAYYYWDHCREKGETLFNTGIGVKYKLSNIQAALGLAQLERAHEIIEKRRKIFFWYKRYLGNENNLIMNVEKKDCYNNYYVPSVIIKNKLNVERNYIINELRNLNIHTRPFFTPLSNLPMFPSVKNINANYISLNGINLPCPSKITEDEVKYVCDALINIIK